MGLKMKAQCKWFLLSLSLIVTTVAGHFGCGTFDYSSEADRIEELRRINLYKESQLSNDRFLRSATGSITIKVHHIILTKADGSQDVSDQVLTDTLALTNQAYQTSPFIFEQDSVTRVPNDVWADLNWRASSASDDVRFDDIAAVYRKGDSTEVNVYWNEGLCSSSAAGFATLPDTFLYLSYPDGEGLPRDGVWMCRTYAARDATDMHYTTVLIHEFGHW